MNIWDVLQIPPTTDKKTIKRAYAKQSKASHPEENPEEFKQLYSAYQVALEYAANAFCRTTSRSEEPEQQPTEDEGQAGPHMETTAEHDELSKAFQEAEEIRRKFVFQWNRLFRFRHQQETHRLLMEYLDSEAFRSIRLDPPVIKHIISTMEQEWRPNGDIYLELWKRYGFQRLNQNGEEGALLQLRNCLAKKLDFLEQEVQQKQRRLEREKKRAQQLRKTRLIVTVAVSLLVLTVTISLRYATATKNQNMYTQLVAHLESTYPHTRFSISDDWIMLNSNSREYTCYSEEFPDMELTARVEKSKAGYQVTDNYGWLILPRYVEKFSLHGFSSDDHNYYWTFYYPDPDEDSLEDFLSRFRDFVKSEEYGRLSPEISFSFCPESALFAEVVIQGGKGGLPEPLLYDIGSIPIKAKLRQGITDSYIAYMMNYESWNLTTDLYDRYEDRYRLLYNQHPTNMITTHGFGPMTGYDHFLWVREQSEFPLHCYIRMEADSFQLGDQAYYQPYEVGYVTVGNAFLYLALCGADIRINEDGSGFAVHKDGQVYQFGQGTESQEFPVGVIYNLVT